MQSIEFGRSDGMSFLKLDSRRHCGILSDDLLREKSAAKS